MIGQRCVQAQIKSAMERKALARFIILVGDTGSGRKTLAKEMSKWLGVECIIVDKGVDAIREVIEQSYKLSEEVVYVLDGDNMSQAAKSALLKVTEEPPNKVRFVLTIRSLNQTLDTLTSRACIFRMDNYTKQDIAAFAGVEDWRYENFCTNKYEVDLVKGYGVKEFTDFVQLAVDNIDIVSGSNAMKMGSKIAFTPSDDGYDMKIFLQAFRTVCMSRVQESDDYRDKAKYLEWINVTTKKIADLSTSTLNKQSLFDMWLFNIRAVTYAND